MKQWRIRAVKVFRLAITHDAPAKRHHPSAPIQDREHDAASEAVIALPVAILGLDQKPGLDHQFFVNIFALERRLQRPTTVRGIAQPEFGYRFVIQSALMEVIKPFLAFGHAQHAFEKRTGCFHDLVKGFGLLFAFLGFAGLFGDFHADLIGQHLDRLDKGQATGIHHKADDIAMRATTKAVIETLLLIDRKGRGFFRMERAQPGIFPAAFDQLHRCTDDIRQSHPRPQVV